MNKALILTIAAAVGLSGGLYLALNQGESPAPEIVADYSAIETLRSGDMVKLQFTTRRGSDVPFLSEDGEEMTLAAYEGKYVVLNFWATWCAPCRHEMPELSALQADMGGDDIEVVTIATGRNPRPAIEQFFAEIGVDNLPLHTDADSSLARDFGALGLPVTLILHPDGHEIARLQGDANWSSDSTKAILAALVADQ